MNGVEKCPQCGAALAEGSTQALCPGCLIALASAPWPEEEAVEEVPLQTVGDYEVLSEIPGGGMGVVFRARQRSLNRLVALKRIRSGRVAGTADVERFRTEAQAAARLDHPNIVPIYEVGEHEGSPFFSMKLIEGVSLAEAIRTKDPRFALARSDPEREVTREEAKRRQERIAALMVKVARAVQHAHDHDVLHRDLKPGNILLDAPGEPHLTDFGLAKLVERSSTATLTTAILGTPDYMSPEQAAGKAKSITTAADIYGLGAILYELLTGTPPFRAESIQETLQQVQEREPVRPRLHHPQVAADLEVICLKCLEKEPGDRYATAGAVAEDLERWLRGEPIIARPAAWPERARKWLRRHPVTVRVGAAAAASLLAAGFVVSQLANDYRDQRFRQEMQRVENLFAKGDRRTAVATLARLARMHWGDTADRVVAERLLNALIQHSFLVPAAPPWSEGTRLVRWSQDGRFLVTADTNSEGSVVRVLERNGRIATEFRFGATNVGSLDISSNRQFVAASSDDRLRVWDLSRKQLVLDQSSPTGRVRQVQLLPNQAVLMLAGDRVVIRKLALDGATREFNGESALLLYAAVSSPANLLAAANDAEAIHIWRLDTGQLLHVIPAAHALVIRDLQFSPDGSRLVSAAADNRARVWVPGTEQPAAELSHADEVFCATFSPDGTHIVTASRDKSARIWEARSGQSLGSAMEHSDAVALARFSPDGQLIVTATDDNTVRLWDGVSGLPLTEPAKFGDPVLEACFSPDGRELLVVVENGGPQPFAPTPIQPRWKVTNRAPPPATAPVKESEPLALHRAHQDRLTFLDLSRDGRLVVTASADRTARLHFRRSGKPVPEPLLHEAAVNCARFSPDSRRVVTSTADRKIRVWDARTALPLTDWIKSEERVSSVWFGWFGADGATVLADSGQAWRVAVVPGKTPAWLPNLAEAVAGARLNEQQAIEPVPTGTFLELKASLSSSSSGDPLSRWARHFLAGTIELPGAVSREQP